MKSRLRSTGIFFASIFFIAAIANFISLSLKGTNIFTIFLDFRNFASIFLLAIGMLASAFIPWLAWIQPFLFLFISAFPIFENTISFFGLGFFVVAILLLFKLGFYEKKRIIKVVASIFYILSVEIYAALRKGEELYDGLMPTIFIIAFIIFLFLTFRDKIIIYLRESKKQLSLHSKGLSTGEIHYVLAIISGKSVKETSFEAGTSESTVRNTLARSYRKLGVTNRAALMALAEKYKIIE